MPWPGLARVLATAKAALVAVGYAENRQSGVCRHQNRPDCGQRTRSRAPAAGRVSEKAYTQTQQAGAAPAIEAVAAVRASVEQEYAGQAGIVGLGREGKAVGLFTRVCPPTGPAPPTGRPSASGSRPIIAA